MSRVLTCASADLTFVHPTSTFLTWAMRLPHIGGGVVVEPHLYP